MIIKNNVNFYIFFFFILFSSIFTNFFHWDEAFYLYTTENYRNLGIFENLDGQKLIFRKQYIFLLSKLGSYFNQESLFFINRIFSFFSRF